MRYHNFERSVLIASSGFDKYFIDPKVIFLAVLLGDELESSEIFIWNMEWEISSLIKLLNSIQDCIPAVFHTFNDEYLNVLDYLTTRIDHLEPVFES